MESWFLKMGGFSVAPEKKKQKSMRNRNPLALNDGIVDHDVAPPKPSGTASKTKYIVGLGKWEDKFQQRIGDMGKKKEVAGFRDKFNLYSKEATSLRKEFDKATDDDEIDDLVIRAKGFEEKAKKLMSQTKGLTK